MTKTLVGIFLGVVFGVPLRLLGGFVLLKYWTWFAVEHIGLRLISYTACVSVLLLCSFFTTGFSLELERIRAKQQDVPSRDALEVVLENLITWAIFYPLLLGIGWLWHWGLS